MAFDLMFINLIKWKCFVGAIFSMFWYPTNIPSLFSDSQISRCLISQVESTRNWVKIYFKFEKNSSTEKPMWQCNKAWPKWGKRAGNGEVKSRWFLFLQWLLLVVPGTKSCFSKSCCSRDCILTNALPAKIINKTTTNWNHEK